MVSRREGKISPRERADLMVWPFSSMHRSLRWLKSSPAFPLPWGSLGACMLLSFPGLAATRFSATVQDPRGAADGSVDSSEPKLILDARRAEHLFNRLGFGARPEEIEAVLGMPATAVFDGWLAKSAAPELPELVYFSWEDYGYNQDGHELPEAPIHRLPREEVIAKQRAMRHADKLQFRSYLDGWFAELVRGDDPLRDRMAFFWHGFFPTSSKVTLRRFEIIKQHNFLRRTCLAGFDDLLRGMVIDPAMLGYFDNDTNSKTHPNENFARELMELYSLGVGNYTEVDVRQAARALTGYQGESGNFVFAEELHDFGEKEILGQRGEFDGADLVEILLEQEACAHYVAGRLLTWLEGVEPDPTRWKRYGDLLRELDYEITPWLRTLVDDPDFYRAQVLGTRVSSPVDYLVGASHRLGLSGHEAFLFYAATAAGQQVYGPPSVKGWDEGRAWITSSSMAIRGNSIGLLLGLLQEHLRHNKKGRDPQAAMEGLDEQQSQRLRNLVLELRAQGFKSPQLAEGLGERLGQELGDEELIPHLAEAWLARAPTEQTLLDLMAELQWCREEYGVRGPLLASPEANTILCHLAYSLLRLPIAQLG